VRSAPPRLRREGGRGAQSGVEAERDEVPGALVGARIGRAVEQVRVDDPSYVSTAHGRRLLGHVKHPDLVGTLTVRCGCLAIPIPRRHAW
jgi:hypothetical protein